MVSFGVRRVGRHGHGGDRHDCEVGYQPGRPVLRQQHNPVTGNDPESSQAARQHANPHRDLAPSQRHVATLTLMPQQRALSVTIRLAEKHRDEVRPVLADHRFATFYSMGLHEVAVAVVCLHLYRLRRELEEQR